MAKAGMDTNLVLFQYLPEGFVLCADEPLQVPDIVATFNRLLLKFCKPLPSLVRETGLAGTTAQDEGIANSREMCQPSRDLIGLAGNEKVDAGVLQVQLVVEVVLEAFQSMIGLAWNDHGPRLTLGRVQLDLLLERVVVDVVEAPSWHRCSLEVLAELHTLVRVLCRTAAITVV